MRSTANRFGSVSAVLMVGVASLAVPLGCSSGASKFGDGDGGLGGHAGHVGAGSGGVGGGGGTGLVGAGGSAGTLGSGGTPLGGAAGGNAGATTGGAGGGTAGKGGSATGGAAGGTAGKGGSATGGGHAGGGGAVGGNGSGGRAGAGGRGGAAASGGAGGKAAPGPECASAADCKLLDDCCRCEAYPAKAQAPGLCELACIQSSCAAHQLPAGAVACVAGRCVAGFNCDTSKVTCKIAVPACEAGFVPAVNAAGTCYAGGCVPAAQCTTVTACSACAPTQTCVIYQTQLGNQFHCVSIPAACGSNSSCECMGPGVCTGSFRSCSDLSGQKGIACSCPMC